MKTRSDSQGNLVSASIVCVPKVCGQNCLSLESVVKTARP